MPKVTIDGVEYERVERVAGVALSILVPSVSTRRKTFAPKIAEALFGQHELLHPADRARVEILMLTDAKGVKLGDKRNNMIRMARGEYVVFVDDDDRVTPDYVASLLAATVTGADCITFDAMVSLNGGPAQVCHYSMEYDRDHNVTGAYHRLPNHITAVRRLLALSNPFPSLQCGEDAAFARALKPMLTTQHRIDRVLYFYDYSDATTETQNQQPQATHVVPIVDVVILSKATNGQLKTMCQQAIKTCLSGAGPGRVRVLVVEQAPGINYDGATTVFEPGDFNYNRFANKAAALCNAEWLMVANSDLEFQPGWLDPLIAAGADCVSPIDPGNKRQVPITSNAAGVVNGVHFSGWCFMVKRELWKKMGGFDDCVRYWCSDDVVIEQCKQQGVTPMVVAASRVRHLVSKTLSSPSDDLTWGEVVKFNNKYGQDRFINDPRYVAYLKKMGQQ